ncbi:hypothetical protein CIPAW_03G247700 [Carya illinoinensis]|uniref:Uncharacterized protein n=1 Tax=Carya illinoinensis TaxID=32201 RepID=A0A8T1R6K3_CARIL|nr:hypothetical protein CIPAW_03G247700 [Carya illinoinensis]
MFIALQTYVRIKCTQFRPGSTTSIDLIPYCTHELIYSAENIIINCDRIDPQWSWTKPAERTSHYNNLLVFLLRTYQKSRSRKAFNSVEVNLASCNMHLHELTFSTHRNSEHEEPTFSLEFTIL